MKPSESDLMIQIQTIMPRCKDCRWWERDNDQNHPNLGTCKCANTDNARLTTFPNEYEDGYGGSDAVLVGTTDDFGCTEWEAKE